MISFFQNLKINKLNGGMTYIEFIVVLSIFSVMSSVILFNYGEFQAKVDIKNLASDIALKIVEAQKSALSGKLPVVSQQLDWKPSYGVYFNRVVDDKSFIHFTDLDSQDKIYNVSGSCPGGECLDKITITKGNYIDKIEICSDANCVSSTSTIIDPLSITFTRPDSSAVFTLEQNSNPSVLSVTGSQYVQITIKSPKGTTAKIKIYPSGRVQVD